ncbi:MAG: lipoprotein insertase outer membrane protein LolB [Steroidobacteraceae bacterium]|nr:lipoprotein insertase outer membrane protein LolB [Steroidobacteraceae bacterium]
MTAVTTGGATRVVAAVRPRSGRRAAHAGAALLVASLAACASLPPARTPAPPPGSAVTSDWPSRRAALQALPRFELKGRIAVAAGEEGFSAGVRWQERQGDALIELDGPFGVGGLRLQARGDALELTTARGERLDGAAARAELERRLGFPLPVAALRYWIRGVPDPASDAAERLAPDAPRLEGLEQGGWRVDYPAYVAVGPVGELPRRVTVSRESTRVRMVIEDWIAGEAR